MSCLCGDLCCSSCGPAQGNSRCPACRAWSSEGCDCTPEQKEAAAKLEAEADRQFTDALAESFRWEDEHAEEIAAAIRQP